MPGEKKEDQILNMHLFIYIYETKRTILIGQLIYTLFSSGTAAARSNPVVPRGILVLITSYLIKKDRIKSLTVVILYFTG